MTDLVGTLLAIALVWLALYAASALVVSFAWPRIGDRIARVAAPAARARWLLVTSLAPAAGPTLFLVAVLLPGLTEALGGPIDHCRSHPDHPHLCLVHPAMSGSPGLAGLLLTTIALALLRVRPALERAARAVAAGARLRAMPSARLAPRLRKIESDRAFCFTVGLWRPAIRVSDGLWRRLTDAQRAVVLAHEFAHVRRREPLVRAVAAVASLGVGERARGEMLDALTRAGERTCDEAAARAVGDRVRVAETLLAVERVVGGRTEHAAPAFAGKALDERVHALLEPDAPDEEPAGRGAWLASALCILGMLLLAVPLHHALEHALELVHHLF